MTLDEFIAELAAQTILAGGEGEWRISQQCKVLRFWGTCECPIVFVVNRRLGRNRYVNTEALTASNELNLEYELVKNIIEAADSYIDLTKEVQAIRDRMIEICHPTGG